MYNLYQLEGIENTGYFRCFIFPRKTFWKVFENSRSRTKSKRNQNRNDPFVRFFFFFSFFSPYFNKSNRGLPKMASATVNAGTQVRTSRSSVGTITGSTNDLVRLQQGVPAWITFTSLYHSRYIRKRVRESYLLTIRSIFVLVLIFFFILSFSPFVHIARNIYIELCTHMHELARV